MKNGIKPARIYAKIIDNASTPIHVVVDEVIPEGALPGLFSVSADKQVRFSKGNLWYDKTPEAGKPYWGFEEHQYDFRTFSEKNSTPTDTYGLFGWGNVPVNGTDIKTVADNSQYETYTEWGSAIDNTGTWRTLTVDEWRYLLFDRDIQKYKEFVTVGEETGLVILPDEFLNGYTFVNSKTTYSLEEWADAKAGGLVFLPTAGESFQGAPALLTRGFYWSSSRSDEPCPTPSTPSINGAYYLGFNVDVEGYHPGLYNNDLFSGYAVRLVHAVPNADGKITIGETGSDGL